MGIEAQKDGRWALKSKKYGYWIGDDATITLSFFAADGTYGLVTSKGTFLSSTGNLVEAEAVDDSCKFVIVFEGGQVSFQAKKTGKFLTSLGKDGTLKATKTSITADEQFVMEDSFP